MLKEIVTKDVLRLFLERKYKEKDADKPNFGFVGNCFIMHEIPISEG